MGAEAGLNLSGVGRQCIPPPAASHRHSFSLPFIVISSLSFPLSLPLALPIPLTITLMSLSNPHPTHFPFLMEECTFVALSFSLLTLLFSSHFPMTQRPTLLSSQHLMLTQMQSLLQCVSVKSAPRFFSCCHPCHLHLYRFLSSSSLELSVNTYCGRRMKSQARVTLLTSTSVWISFGDTQLRGMPEADELKAPSFSLSGKLGVSSSTWNSYNYPQQGLISPFKNWVCWSES